MLERRKELRDIQGSFDTVFEKIARQDNITDPSKSDGRCKANEFLQTVGALPDGIKSPEQDSSKNESFIGGKGEAYHAAQNKLFYLLRRDCKLGREFTWSHGALKRKGNINITAVELCNTIDEITLLFLDEVGKTPNSVTGKAERGKELREMIDCVVDIVANQGVSSWAIEDDIFTASGHKKWKLHLNKMASFTALWISMEEAKI